MYRQVKHGISPDEIRAPDRGVHDGAGRAVPRRAGRGKKAESSVAERVRAPRPAQYFSRTLTSLLQTYSFDPPSFSFGLAHSTLAQPEWTRIDRFALLSSDSPLPTRPAQGLTYTAHARARTWAYRHVATGRYARLSPHNSRCRGGASQECPRHHYRARPCSWARCWRRRQQVPCG